MLQFAVHRRDFLASSLLAAAGLSLRHPLPAFADVETTSSLPVSPSEAVAFLTPDSPGYAEARRVFAARLVLKPALIALCATEEGAVRSIDRAKKNNMPVAIKAGGHSFEAFCL